MKLNNYSMLQTFLKEDEELEKAYQEASHDQTRRQLAKEGQKATLKDLQKRL